MASEFLGTFYGKKLFEHDLPTLWLHIQILNEHLKKIAQELEALVAVTAAQSGIINEIYKLAKASEDAYTEAKEKRKEEDKGWGCEGTGDEVKDDRGENPGLLP